MIKGKEYCDKNNYIYVENEDDTITTSFLIKEDLVNIHKKELKEVK